MNYHVPPHVPINAERVSQLTTPQGRPFRVALCYKNAGKSQSGHIGLGVTAAYQTRYLREKGIYTDVWGIDNLRGLDEKITESYKVADVHPVTHVVMCAPFVGAAEIQTFAIQHPQLQFAITCHSNIGFLAADPQAFYLLREYALVQDQIPNFRVAANSKRLVDWFTCTYNMPMEWLPNLYHVDGLRSQSWSRKPWSGDLLRVGCFGAMRVLKNMLSAGAGALQLSAQLRVDLEFSISSDRIEGGGSVLNSLSQMFAGIKSAKLIPSGWQNWGAFRATVAHQDLLFQPSYTESFNNVTADGVAMGISSVVGPAIEWAPEDWKADVDHPSDLARVGNHLLHSPDAAKRGLEALTRHNEEGFRRWLQFLIETTPHR